VLRIKTKELQGGRSRTFQSNVVTGIQRSFTQFLSQFLARSMRFMVLLVVSRTCFERAGFAGLAASDSPKEG